MIRDPRLSEQQDRALRYTAAVAAMCAACEPGGLCRTAECPLQMAGVSPLPLARSAVA